MGFYCKCINCGRTITNTNLEDKTGYKLSEDSAVCDKCYFIYFNKVRDFLYEHPGADIKTIHQKTGVRIRLIELFYEEGALEEAVNLLVQQEQQRNIESEQIKKETIDRYHKIQNIREMSRLMNTRPNTESDGPKMRFLDKDPDKRRR